jgi:tRNA pseudouridine38-40 synthase
MYCRLLRRLEGVHSGVRSVISVSRNTFNHCDGGPIEREQRRLLSPLTLARLRSKSIKTPPHCVPCLTSNLTDSKVYGLLGRRMSSNHAVDDNQSTAPVMNASNDTNGTTDADNKPSDATPADSTAHKRERKNEKSNKHGKKQQNKRKPRNANADFESKRRRQPEDADNDSFNGQDAWSQSPSSKDPHPGSYVHPDQRKSLGMPPLSFTPDGHPERPIEASADKTVHQSAQETVRVKRKVALLLGYLGTDYNGFQINAGQPTLQAELEFALWRAHCLHSRNVGYPHKYSWSTSGRTDKGVHACAQVISCKIELEEEVLGSNSKAYMDRVREEINHFLPPTVRVLDLVRTTRNFCARTQRDKVRYQYMVPAFALVYTPAEMRRMFEECQIESAHINNGVSGSDSIAATTADAAPAVDTDAKDFNNNGPSTGFYRSGANPLSDDEIRMMQKKLVSARVSPEHTDHLKQALQNYVGTHSFHNLSRGVAYKEARAMRYILSFEVEDPIVLDDSGMQWIPTQVLGQSFLMHQIRKMICLAIDVARGALPQPYMSRVLNTSEMINVNVAPSQTLFMEMSFYEGYNRRKNIQAANEAEDLVWTDPDTDVYKRWNDFRHNVIMKHIAEEEVRSGNFVKHLYLQEFMFNYKAVDDAIEKTTFIDKTGHKE